jgi:transketolase
MSQIEMKSTREGFGEGLVEAAEKNKNVVALTADLAGSTGIKDFTKKFPDRFIQVGVAEQNLVTVASGLAHAGKIPFATTFAAFSPGRNWEQIRTTICYNNQPVKIASTHTGLGVGEDGATHQMLEDIALMRALPNMIVIAPSDSEEARQATIKAAKIKKPVYLRLGRQKLPIIHEKNYKFEIGKAEIIKKGKDITIIACGPMVYEALKAANQIEKRKNGKITIELINCATIKPLDEKTIIASAKKTKKVITVEDHQINGGMGSAVAELLSKEQPTKMKIMGVNDTFGESGVDKDLFDKHKLNSHNIIVEIEKFLQKK